MENFITKEIINMVMKITNANSLDILIHLLIIAFIIWIYKQLKIQQFNTLERKKNTMSLAMENMSQILYEVHKIKRYGNKEDLLDSFYGSVYKAYPFLDDKVYEKINKVMTSLKSKEEKVDIIGNEIEKVYKNLVRQKEPIIESTYLSENMDRFIHKVLLIFAPIVQSVIVVFVLIFLTLIAFSEINSIWMFIKPATVIPWIYQLTVFVDSVYHKEITPLGAILLLLSLSSGYLMFFNEGIISFVYFIGWLMLMVSYRLLIIIKNKG